MITVKQGLPKGEHDVHVSTINQGLDGKVERDEQGNLIITVKEVPTDGFVVIELRDEHKSCYAGMIEKGIFSPCSVPADYKQAPAPAPAPRTSVPISESIDYNEETEND